MSDYPRDLLIKEDVIREFEEQVGVRFVNKTECSKALTEHDAKVIDDFLNEVLKLKIYKQVFVDDLRMVAEQMKEKKNETV